MGGGFGPEVHREAKELDEYSHGMMAEDDARAHSRSSSLLSINRRVGKIAAENRWLTS